MRKYDLVVSSDERHKEEKQKILFLGNWCKDNSSYKRITHKIAEPYALLHSMRLKDQAKVRSYEKELIIHLTDSLNIIHSANIKDSSWKIIIGHWLRELINTLLNRYNTINHCIGKYDINSIKLVKYNNFSLIPNDTLEASANYNNPIMDEFLFDHILSNNDYNYLEKNYIIDSSDRKKIRSRLFCSTKKNKTGFISFINNVILSRIYRDKDIFVISSLLSFKDELLLNVSLGNFPKIWRVKQFFYNKSPDAIMRDNLNNCLKSNIRFKDYDKFFQVLVDLIPKIIPLCFMESFKDLECIVNKLNWPKNPKCIYTCNNFTYDEVFKLWLSKKILSGSKYVVGQHGNNYGTNRYKSPFIEEETATEFITWGYNNKLNSKKGLILRDHKVNRKKNASKVLFVTTHYPNRNETWDETYEYEIYKKNQFNFVTKLDDHVKRQLVVRLSKNSQIYFGKDDISEWKNFDNKIFIDNGFTKIKTLIRNSKVVIYDYDSTGMLECIGNNIPTLAYWSNGLDHLNDYALKDYKKLVEIGIIHLSPKSLANMLNKSYYDIDDWWFSEKTQEKINEFKKKYANSQPNTIRKIKDIICK